MSFLDELASLVSGTPDAVKGTVEHFRQDLYPKARNKLATTALALGGLGADKDSKKILHEQGNYNLTSNLAHALPFLPPEVGANLSDAAYLGNETFTGGLSKLAGRPFFSQYGFSFPDVSINRHGQDRALEDLNAERDRRWAGMRRSFRGVE